jgi:MSHA biogenesis protein MshO
MNAPLIFPKQQRGFTLVEAIVVMVITGILASVMVLFIRKPVQNYVDAAGRADMSDAADLALRRMVRELHGALPNSIRITTVGTVTLLEFIPTKAGGTYLAEEDDAGTPYLDFVLPGTLPPAGSNFYKFTVVGDMPVAPYNIVSGDHIVVYNLGPGYDRADAYSNLPNSMNRTQVSSVSGNVVTMTSNPFAVAAGSVPNSSPTHRFNIVAPPVTFRCDPTANGVGELKRYWNYNSVVNVFQDNQVDPQTLGTKSSALLANYVTSCTFAYSNTINLQHGLVGLSLTLGRANSAESVTLTQQVNVENTP